MPILWALSISGFCAGFITHIPLWFIRLIDESFLSAQKYSTSEGIFLGTCKEFLERLKIKKIGMKIGNDQELSMELLQLEYFYAVAKTQRVTHTARTVTHCTACLHQSISTGWKKIGMPLFSPQRQKYLPWRMGCSIYGIYLKPLSKMSWAAGSIAEMANVRKRTIGVKMCWLPDTGHTCPDFLSEIP